MTVFLQDTERKRHVSNYRISQVRITSKTSPRQYFRKNYSQFIKERDLLFKFKSPDCPRRGICGRKVFLKKRIKQNINSEVATRGVY